MLLLLFLIPVSAASLICTWLVAFLSKKYPQNGISRLSWALFAVLFLSTVFSVVLPHHHETITTDNVVVDMFHHLATSFAFPGVLLIASIGMMRLTQKGRRSMTERFILSFVAGILVGILGVVWSFDLKERFFGPIV